jgi:hypothetical protein
MEAGEEEAEVFGKEEEEGKGQEEGQLWEEARRMRRNGWRRRQMDTEMEEKMGKKR